MNTAQAEPDTLTLPLFDPPPSAPPPLDMHGHTGRAKDCEACTHRNADTVLYLATRAFSDGHVSTKIGISCAPCSRMGGLQTRGMPRVVLVHVQPVPVGFFPVLSLDPFLFALDMAFNRDRPAAGQLERYLHNAFNGRRTVPARRGRCPSEWFDVPPEEIAKAAQARLLTWHDAIAHHEAGREARAAAAAAAAAARAAAEAADFEETSRLFGREIAETVAKLTALGRSRRYC